MISATSEKNNNDYWKELDMDKIDFIITWVDGNDPKWQEEKRKYDGKSAADSRNVRYRDWDNLRFWFRGVEKYAPWVNNIFFVTWGHLPEWLDTSNPKLRIVKHSDYIPEKYLPTFSSRTIDMNFHRIPELTEHFVYFNDDMFLISPVKPELFFKRGLPCETAIMNTHGFGYGEKNAKDKTPSYAVYTAPAFDMIPINRYFDKRRVIKDNFWKWFSPHYGFGWIRTLLLWPWRGFTGMMDYHLPYSYLKDSYREVWEKEEALLDQTCMHKFRVNSDLNHWVFNYWQIAKGNFTPRSPKIGKSIWLTNEIEANANAFEAIRNQKYKMICLNDNVFGDNFDLIKEQLINCFESILPEKSSFEK